MDQKQRDLLLNEKLSVAGAMEVMIATKGWEHVRAYIENKIKTFANEAITKGFPSIEEFNLARGEVNALRTLIGHIDDHIQTLYDYRTKQQASGSTQE